MFAHEDRVRGQTQGQVGVRVPAAGSSGSPLLGHQGPSEWLGHFWVYEYFFFLKLPCCNLAFKNKAKPPPGSENRSALEHSLCRGHLCDLLGVAGSAPHVQGGAVISPRSMLTAAHPWTSCFCTCGKLGPRNSMCPGDAAHPFPTGKGSGGSQSPAVPWPLAPHAQSGGHSGRCSVYTIAF